MRLDAGFLATSPSKLPSRRYAAKQQLLVDLLPFFSPINDDPIFNIYFPGPPCFPPGLLLKVILSAVNLMFVKLESIQSRFVEAAVEKKFGTKLSGGYAEI